MINGIIFAGISEESRRCDRVAMIEDSEGILLRIVVDGVKSREVEVRLLIGIGLSSWPCSTDYPQRIPLYHCDALLHYTAAQSVSVDNRSLSLYLIFFPHDRSIHPDRSISRSSIHPFSATCLAPIREYNTSEYIEN